MAQLPLAADLGRVRRADVSDGQRLFPVRRPHPRPGGDARSVGRLATQGVRHLVVGLARHGRAVAPLPRPVHVPCRPGDAAGYFGAQRRVVGLRRVDRPGVALDDLRTLLRRRSGAVGPRHGVDTVNPDAWVARPERLHHQMPPRGRRQAAPVRVADRQLQLCRGVLHGLVRRRAGGAGGVPGRGPSAATRRFSRSCW